MALWMAAQAIVADAVVKKTPRHSNCRDYRRSWNNAGVFQPPWSDTARGRPPPQGCQVKQASKPLERDSRVNCFQEGTNAKMGCGSAASFDHGGRNLNPPLDTRPSPNPAVPSNSAPLRRVTNSLRE